MKNVIPKDEREVVEMADLFKQRVIKGQPLVVTGKLDDSMAKKHAATVNGLLTSIGRSVTVMHIPK
ncbi:MULTISPECIES: hypothetical protein [Delftia]|uniref:Uncharacterized protein n=1 Tax=Delftia lacustris TaxID=558537 RepID=A0A1H3MVY2_9BURK|nr:MULTISPECIES: hypothetical protein [Delftia]QPS78380.1 hypothetical protein I6G48_32190 [Delftia acidovorans]QPS84940.1 hypothetical protein I6G47_32865 [Delftia lacustris]SDY80365.1 hypothetical protein SAMN05421547_10851 [Delftia lacustris]